MPSFSEVLLSSDGEIWAVESAATGGEREGVGERGRERDQREGVKEGECYNMYTCNDNYRMV